VWLAAAFSYIVWEKGGRDVRNSRLTYMYTSIFMQLAPWMCHHPYIHETSLMQQSLLALSTKRKPASSQTELASSSIPVSSCVKVTHHYVYIVPELPAEVVDVRALLLVVLTFSLASLVARSNHGNSNSLLLSRGKGWPNALTVTVGKISISSMSSSFGIKDVILSFLSSVGSAIPLFLLYFFSNS
jgi:hypothetical protein